MLFTVCNLVIYCSLRDNIKLLIHKIPLQITTAEIPLQICGRFNHVLIDGVAKMTLCCSVVSWVS